MVFEFIAAVETVDGFVTTSISIVKAIRGIYGAPEQVPVLIEELDSIHEAFYDNLQQLRNIYDREKPEFDKDDIGILDSRFREMTKLAKDSESDLRKAESSLEKVKVCKLLFAIAAYRKTGELTQVKERVQDAKKLSDGIFELLFRVKHIKKYGHRPDKFQPSFEVPPVPSHVHLRYDKPGSPEAILKDKALRNILSPSSAKMTSTTCVLGMNGTGKSCAVRGLAAKDDIKRRYKGGIYLLPLGPQASVESINIKLRNILTLAGGRDAASELKEFADHDSTHVIVQKIVAFSKGHCLFLIDDVTMVNGIRTQTVTQLLGLAKCSHRSHVILTTTSTSIAKFADDTIKFKPLGVFSEKARDILLRVAGFRESQLDRKAKEAVTIVLKRCAGIHVALAVAGGGVHAFVPETSKGRMRNEAWGKYLRAYSDTRHLLDECRITGYPGLRQNLVTSLKILHSEWGKSTSFSMKRMFRSFCVLEANQWVCLDVLRKAWKLRSDEEAEIVIRKFQEKNLVNVNTTEVRSLTYSNRPREVRLSKKMMTFVYIHLLVQIFARLMTESLDGKDGIRNWHRQFLDSVLQHDEESEKKGLRSWWNCSFANEVLAGYGQKFDVEHHLRGGDHGRELSLLRKDKRWILPSNIMHSNRGLEINNGNVKMFIPELAGSGTKGDAKNSFETEMEVKIGAEDGSESDNTFHIVVEGTESSSDK